MYIAGNIYKMDQGGRRGMVSFENQKKMIFSEKNIIIPYLVKTVPPLDI